MSALIVFISPGIYEGNKAGMHPAVRAQREDSVV